MKFRDLRADEIECRIGYDKKPTENKKGGVRLLLYKDARVDMALLDETVGSMNWMKSYNRDNRNCTVSIWDESKGQWIDKEDTGTESNTEAEKGLASDSFKRACFCWGIGRELYTAPFIWISGATKEDKFWVKDMEVRDHKITGLIICACDSYGNKTDTVAYAYPRGWKGTQVEDPKDLGTVDTEEKINETHWKAMQEEIKKYGLSPKAVINHFGFKSPSEISYQSEHDIIMLLPELAEEAKKNAKVEA